MLAIFDTQINSLESALNELLLKVEAHREQLKAAKARQRKTTKLIANLRGLIEELPSDAYANLRESILSLFPSPQLPTTDNSGNHSSGTAPEEMVPILKAIEEVQQAKPELLGDLPDLGKNPEERTFQGQPEKPASDIPIATAPAELQNAFSQVPQATPE